MANAGGGGLKYPSFFVHSHCHELDQARNCSLLNKEEVPVSFGEGGALEDPPRPLGETSPLLEEKK